MIKTVSTAAPTKDVNASTIRHRPPRAHPRPIRVEFHKRAAEDGVAEEPPAQGHALHAGWHRDQGADAGDQVPDQDRLSPVALEHPARPFEVGDEEELGALESPDHAPQMRLPDPEPDGVHHERGTYPGRRRRE